MHTYIHKCIYIHTYTSECIHTHTHTHTGMAHVEAFFGCREAVRLGYVHTYINAYTYIQAWRTSRPFLGAEKPSDWDADDVPDR